MKIHTITKQKILSEPFTPDALKLAKALYNTYIKDDKNLYMEVRVSAIAKLLRVSADNDGINYIIKLLEELNEPILVKDFKFYNKLYPMRFLKFCTYKFDGDMLEVELNPEYLLVESEYMIDKFLS